MTDSREEGYPTGWNADLVKFHAQDSTNQGICSILVGNLLVLTRRLQSSENIKSQNIDEVYFDGQFLSVASEQQRRNGLFSRNKTKQVQQLFVPISDTATPPTTAIPYTIGMHKDNFGILLPFGQFVPLVRLVEGRNPNLDESENARKVMCSYGELNTSVMGISGDGLVVTTEDESNGLVAMLSEDLKYHVTAEVIRAIQNCLDLDSEIPIEQRLETLRQFFDFEKISARALGISIELNYGDELLIRTYGRLLSQEIDPFEKLQIRTSTISDDDNPALEMIREIYYSHDGDGSFEFEERVHWPNLPYNDPKTTATVKFSKQIGNVVYVGDNLVAPEYQEIIEFTKGLTGENLGRLISSSSLEGEFTNVIDFLRHSAENRSLQDKTLDVVEQALNRELAESLKAFESERGFLIRLDLENQRFQTDEMPVGVPHEFISKQGLILLIESMAGIDSLRADAIRQRFLDLAKDKAFEDHPIHAEIIFAVARSCAGVNSEFSWKLREYLHQLELPQPFFSEISKFISVSDISQVQTAILHSLIGIDEGWAEQYRAQTQSFFDTCTIGLGSDFFDSQAGADSDLTRLYISNRWGSRISEESFRATSGLKPDLFERAFNKLENSYSLKFSRALMAPDVIAQAVKGQDSNFAWKIRKRIQDCDPPMFHDLDSLLVSSLAGLDSAKSWRLRNRVFSLFRRIEITPLSLANSLAGLNSEKAEQMRSQLMKSAANLSQFKGRQSVDPPFSPGDIDALVATSYLGGPTSVVIVNPQRHVARREKIGEAAERGNLAQTGLSLDPISRPLPDHWFPTPPDNQRLL